MRVREGSEIDSRPVLRRPLRGFAILILALALLGHWLYWYQPKERPGAADPADLPARLLADPRASLALWLPFPHQNLSAANDALGDLEALATALARRGSHDARARPVELPRFGPFVAPPARELGAAWYPDGGVAIAARVYPGLALFARLAGKVAGNPWLAGGTVQLAGKNATVTWDGSLWLARTDGAVLPGPVDSSDPGPPLDLGAFALGRGSAAPPLPAGRYHLRRNAAGALEAELAGGVPWPAVPPVTLATAEAALLVVRGAGRPDWIEAFESPGALAVSAHAASSGLPQSATFAPAGFKAWKLPARGLAELLNGEPEELEQSGLRLVATEEVSRATAEALAPTVAAWLGPSHPDFVVGLWLEPRAVRRALGGSARLFADLPFLGHRREAATIDDWRTVLTPLDGFAEVSVVIFENPDRARITLVPRVERGGG